MGRLNLAPLRVRRRALANIQTRRNEATPIWLDITADIPPAQILIHKQPQQHPLTQIRTGKQGQVAISHPPRKPPTRKNARLFSPLPIRYEEDTLRHRFFTDHPWELARPRLTIETDGDSHARADWSTGLLQPGIPLSGESVVQRQLYLLNNVKNIRKDKAYDIARKEFYDLRRQEDTRRRIAAEEARATGAQFGKGALGWGMKVENAQYDEWEKWAKDQVVIQQQRSAAFAGNTMAVEEDALEDTSSGGDGGNGRGIGAPGQGTGRPAMSAIAATAALRARSQKKIIE